MEATLVTELADGMDAVLSDVLSVDVLLEVAKTGGAMPEPTQEALSSLGLHDLYLPESEGGFDADGFAALVLGIVGGRRLLPPLLREQAAVVRPMLSSCPDTAEFTAEMGSHTVGVGVVVVHEPQLAAWGSGRVSLPPTLGLVPANADAVVLVTPDAGAIIRTRQAGIQLHPATSHLDPGQGLSMIELSDAVVPPQWQVDAGTARQLWTRSVLTGLGDAVGCAETALDWSVEYAHTREQFGRQIGSFQAVAHRLARMRADLESCRSMLGRLVHVLADDDDGEDASGLLPTAMHWVPGRARSIVESAVQVHGGIGFTWELGLHLYLRRALALQALLGGANNSARVVGRAYRSRRSQHMLAV